jgi:hypothetical protein
MFSYDGDAIGGWGGLCRRLEISSASYFYATASTEKEF